MEKGIYSANWNQRAQGVIGYNLHHECALNFKFLNLCMLKNIIFAAKFIQKWKS